MKKVSIVFTFVIFFGLLQWGYSQTANPQPGSVDDPLITKGYVDEQVTNQILLRTEQIRTELNQMIATNVTKSVQTELQKQTGEMIRAELDKQLPDQVRTQVDQNMNEKAKFKLLIVPSGQTITFLEGAEVIIRSGKASVTSPDANGISDLTDGTDLKPGSAPVKNHLLLFPRDGRGLMVASGLKSGAAIMVKGGYVLLGSAPTPTPAGSPEPSAQPLSSATPAGQSGSVSNNTNTGLLQ